MSRTKIYPIKSTRTPAANPKRCAEKDTTEENDIVDIGTDIIIRNDTNRVPTNVPSIVLHLFNIYVRTIYGVLGFTWYPVKLALFTLRIVVRLWPLLLMGMVFLIPFIWVQWVLCPTLPTFVAKRICGLPLIDIRGALFALMPFTNVVDTTSTHLTDFDNSWHALSVGNGSYPSAIRQAILALQGLIASPTISSPLKTMISDISDHLTQSVDPLLTISPQLRAVINNLRIDNEYCRDALSQYQAASGDEKRFNDVVHACQSGAKRSIEELNNLQRMFRDLEQIYRDTDMQLIYLHGNFTYDYKTTDDMIQKLTTRNWVIKMLQPKQDDLQELFKRVALYSEMTQIESTIGDTLYDIDIKIRMYINTLEISKHIFLKTSEKGNTNILDLNIFIKQVDSAILWLKSPSKHGDVKGIDGA